MFDQLVSLFERAQNLLFELQKTKGEAEGMLRRLEDLEKGFDAEEVQNAIVSQVRERIDMAKIEEVNGLIVKAVLERVERDLVQSDWSLRGYVEKEIRRRTIEELRKTLEDKATVEQLKAIVRDNLSPAIDEVLKAAVSRIVDEGVDHVVREELKQRVEDLPEMILLRFGYKVEGDP